MDEIAEIIRASKDISLQEEQDKILQQPFIYVSKIPSHQNRSKLSRALNHWLQIPEDKLQLISEITQITHDSSLLLDDIEDNSTIRRGMQVAHEIYGVGITINSANYSFFKGVEKVYQLNHPDAFKMFTEQILESHRGQGIDLYWRESFTIPNEMDYKLMAVRKRGGIIMILQGLMQLFSTNKKDFSRLIVALSLYLQIIDDYLNLVTKDLNGTKSFCEDITEGKFSFPIIHALKHEKYKSDVLNILKQRTSDIEVKKYCIRLIENAGSLKYTRDALEALDKKIREEANKLGPNPYMESFMNDLLVWQ